MSEEELLKNVGNMFIECIPALLRFDNVRTHKDLHDYLFGKSFGLNKKSSMSVRGLLNNLKFTYTILQKDPSEVQSLIIKAKDIGILSKSADVKALEEQVYTALFKILGKMENYKKARGEITFKLDIISRVFPAECLEKYINELINIGEHYVGNDIEYVYEYKGVPYAVKGFEHFNAKINNVTLRRVEKNK